MRLKDTNRTPPGGFYYDDPLTEERISTDGNFDKLLAGVRSWYHVKGIPEPDKLSLRIQDQICMRVPKELCWYSKGLGDQISKVIHAAAAVVDKVAGTQLEKKARGCRKCGQRRIRIN